MSLGFRGQDTGARFVAGLRHLPADERGMIMAEAALVLPVVLVFLLIPPAIHHLWSRQQASRTEAHRDTFDKTAGPFYLAEPRVSRDFFGITAARRGHAFPRFPMPPEPRSTDQWKGVLGLEPGKQTSWSFAGTKPRLGDDKDHASPPDSKSYSWLGGLLEFSTFPGGFPNQFVEGWQWERVRLSEQVLGKSDMDITTYAAVIRSTWTWLGWPFIPTQDILSERAQIKSWWDGLGIDDDTSKALNLLD